MLVDLGSRDDEFARTVAEIRTELLRLGGVSQAQGYECVIVQGSGTFGIESVLSSALAPHHHLLVLANGAYGDRMAAIAQVHRIPHTCVRLPEDQPVTPAVLRQAVQQCPQATHIGTVHCETTTGILNPAQELGTEANRLGLTFILDSMSAFGGIPLNVHEAGCHFLVSSSNKCIEGVPGFSFVLAQRAALQACAGQARTLTLDLHAQWHGLEHTGQFRFTPPTHALLAFRQALRELEAEGGVAARHARYSHANALLAQGMQRLGFRAYLPPHLQAPVITTFRYPEHPGFQFAEFYRRLAERGFVLYPGKLSQADCFRIGNIGQVHPPDIQRLLAAIAEVLAEMGVQLG
jgi:2-aminoethylphosphonate-pyruvate transaminase